MKRNNIVLVFILLHCTCLHCVGQGLPSTSFSQRIHELGLDSISCDYSLNTSFSIPTPSCAYADEWNKWKDSKCIKESQYAWCWKPLEEWNLYQKRKEVRWSLTIDNSQLTVKH